MAHQHLKSVTTLYVQLLLHHNSVAEYMEENFTIGCSPFGKVGIPEPSVGGKSGWNKNETKH